MNAKSYEEQATAIVAGISNYKERIEECDEEIQKLKVRQQRAQAEIHVLQERFNEITNELIHGY